MRHVLLFFLISFFMVSSVSAFELGKAKFFNDIDLMVKTDDTLPIIKMEPWRYRIDYVGKWTFYDRFFVKPILIWDFDNAFSLKQWNYKITVGVYVWKTWSVRYQYQDQKDKNMIQHVGVGVEF